MAELNPTGVQHQALRLRAGCWRSVEIVAKDRMPHGLHVNPQLVRAPGHWLKFDARQRLRCAGVEYAISGEARPAHGVIDYSLRAVGPVNVDGELDLPRECCGPLPIDQGLVALAHQALLEHDAQVALRLGTAPHDDDARRAHVQSMNDHGVGHLSLHPARQAILLAGTATGNAQQPAGLVDNDQLRREIENGKSVVGRRIVGCGWHAADCLIWTRVAFWFETNAVQIQEKTIYFYLDDSWHH